MYNLIEIPIDFRKEIYSFDKTEAKNYFNWYNQIKNERVNVLLSHVNNEFENWKLDNSRESLHDLFIWFVNNISFRNINQSEIEKIKLQISKTPQFIDVIEIPKYVLSEQSIAICFDISIYFGDTIIKNTNNCSWGQKLNSKSFIDYASPVILSNDYKVPFNIRRVIENLAEMILENSDKTFTFQELYDEAIANYTR